PSTRARRPPRVSSALQLPDLAVDLDALRGVAEVDDDAPALNDVCVVEAGVVRHDGDAVVRIWFERDRTAPVELGYERVVVGDRRAGALEQVDQLLGGR